MSGRRERPIGFLLPWAVGFGLLTLLPLLATIGLSFARVESTSGATRVTWIGLQHYREACGVDHAYRPTEKDPWSWRVRGGRPLDPALVQALGNSLYYALLSVPLGLCLSLATAMLLNQPVRGAVLFRAMVYLPHVLGGVATLVIWSWLFNPQFGWINQAIRLLYGLLDPVVALWWKGGTRDWPLPHWLYSPSACKPAVIIMSAWSMGGSMLIFLAALRRVAPELLEAAVLDGAGAWRRFRSITFPQLTPALLFNAALGLVFAMQAFNEAYLLQNRQQDGGLLFYVLYLYQVAFESPYRFGYASALAVILLGVLVLLVLPLFATARRWVHYPGEGAARV